MNDQTQQNLPTCGFQKFKIEFQSDFPVAVFLGILTDFDHSITILMTSYCYKNQDITTFNSNLKKIALKLFLKKIKTCSNWNLILTGWSFWVKVIIQICSKAHLGKVWCWRFGCLRPGWAGSNLDWKVGLFWWFVKWML